MNNELGNGPLLDAVLAGLRLLQNALEEGEVSPNDGDLGDILTNSGQHPGMTAEEIEDVVCSIDAVIKTGDRRFVSLAEIRERLDNNPSAVFVEVTP